MAGKNGFSHSCDSTKVAMDRFKQSIRDSHFTSDQISLIWDFYVVRSFASVTGLQRALKDYGWSSTPKGKRGHIALERLLMNDACVSELCTIRAKSIKDTLAAMDLSSDRICIEHPRIVLMQDYSVSVDENENFSFNVDEGRIRCLFRHVQNALAHGNTYFFENGNILLLDFNGKTCTAAILIPQRCLLSWISIVDFDKKYYAIKLPDSKSEEGTAS